MLLVRAPSVQSLSQGLSDSMTGSTSAFHAAPIVNGATNHTALTGATIAALPAQNSLQHALTSPVAAAQPQAALSLANYGQLNGSATSPTSLVAAAGLSQSSSSLLGLTDRVAAAAAMPSQLSLKVRTQQVPILPNLSPFPRLKIHLLENLLLYLI